MADPFVGKLSLMKITSGVLTPDITLYNVNAEKTEKPGTIYILKGKKQATTTRVCAGDLCAPADTADRCDRQHPVRRS